MTETILKGVGFVVIAILASMILAYPMMILWNQCLIPAVPGLQEVNWLQMWGIGILIKTLTR